MKRCEITVVLDPVFDTYCKCNKPAKHITPVPPRLHKGDKPRKQYYVCGIHKNSTDKMHKKIGSDERCKPISD